MNLLNSKIDNGKDALVSHLPGVLMTRQNTERQHLKIIRNRPLEKIFYAITGSGALVCFHINKIFRISQVY